MFSMLVPGCLAVLERYGLASHLVNELVVQETVYPVDAHVSEQQERHHA